MSGTTILLWQENVFGLSQGYQSLKMQLYKNIEKEDMEHAYFQSPEYYLPYGLQLIPREGLLWLSPLQLLGKQMINPQQQNATEIMETTKSARSGFRCRFQPSLLYDLILIHYPNFCAPSLQHEKNNILQDEYDK